MSLRECRECGHAARSEDAACPHCGAPMRQRSKLAWVGFAVVGLVATVVVSVSLFQPGKVPRAAVQKESPLVSLGRQVDDLLTDGIVTKAEGRAIWVEPALWRRRSAEEKQSIATLYGSYAGLKDGSNRSACEVRDNRTGKVIAEWSPTSGLKPLEP